MNLLKNTSLIFVLTFILLSSKNLKAIQSITDDTLYFHDEQEFHDFLEFNGLKFYDIVEPAVSFNCEEGSTVPLYTFQDPSDYLHEELFVGMNFSVIIDHLITTKVFNVLMPTIGDPDATVCSVNLTIHHPDSDQVAIFYDIYNWIDENGQNIFNFNKKMYFLWGFNSGKIDFDRELIQEVTGYDFTFPTDMTSHPINLNFDSIEIYNQITYYPDSDSDSFGDATAPLMAYPFAPPSGYVLDSTDCDDTNPNSYPGAVEVLDGFDNNCNDTIDEGFVSISEIENIRSVTIYPNPAKNYFAIEMNFLTINSAEVSISLFNALGENSYFTKKTYHQNSKEIIYLKNNLGSGIYLLKIEANNQVINKNIFIENQP